MSLALHRGSFWLAWALLGLLTACGQERQISGFESYVSAFEQVSRDVGHPTTVGSIVIDFEPIDAVGQCEWGDWLHSPHIRINPDQWQTLGETGRQILLFHELGHCVLNRDHRTDRREDRSPASIMFPSLLNPIVYRRDREYYQHELFEGNGSGTSDRGDSSAY